MDGSSLTGTDLGSITGMTVLPDATVDGNFLRQAKANRQLGSAEGDAIRNIEVTFAFTDNNTTTMYSRVRSASSAFEGQNATGNHMDSTSVPGSITVPSTIRLDASKVVPTADENRPKNIAVNHFVKVNNDCN